MENKKEITWLHARKFITKFLVAIFFACAFMGIGSSYKEYKMQPKIDSLQKDVNTLSWNILSKTKLTWQNINFWIDYFEVQQKEIVVAQIILETDSLRSCIALENNNLFGFKVAKQRETTCTYSNRGHAGYSNYILSIQDYSIWQETYYDGKMDYYQFLIKSGYAQDSLYTHHLRSIVKNINSLKNKTK